MKVSTAHTTKSLVKKVNTFNIRDVDLLVNEQPSSSSNSSSSSTKLVFNKLKDLSLVKQANSWDDAIPMFDDDDDFKLILQPVEMQKKSVSGLF